MKGKNVMISHLFDLVQMYVNNTSKQAEIQKKMNTHGFTPKRMQDGKVLSEEVRMLFDIQTEKYTEKEKLSNLINASEQQTRQTLIDHVNTVKHVFRKNPDMLTEFGIKPVSRNVKEWIFQADMFYNKAAKYAKVLTPHGLPQAEIDRAVASVEALSTARHQRILRKGEAEEATRVRDQKLKALQAWMNDFRSIARIALQDSPQLLESLGIIVKPKKPRRKPTEVKKDL